MCSAASEQARNISHIASLSRDLETQTGLPPVGGRNIEFEPDGLRRVALLARSAQWCWSGQPDRYSLEW